MTLAARPLFPAPGAPNTATFFIVVPLAIPCHTSGTNKKPAMMAGSFFQTDSVTPTNRYAWRQ